MTTCQRCNHLHNYYVQQYDKHRQMRSDYEKLKNEVQHLEHLKHLTEEFSHGEAGELRRSVEAFKALKTSTTELRKERDALCRANRRLEIQLDSYRSNGEVTEDVIRTLRNLTSEIQQLRSETRQQTHTIEMLTERIDTLKAENTALTATNRQLRLVQRSAS